MNSPHKEIILRASGAVTAMQLGNGKWENTVFNSRMQPKQIGLGNGVNSQNLLKLVYSYGTTGNNGNVVSQTITVPGIAQPFVQTYTYDELNRLKTATETQNSTQTWKQAFNFDRYGNRNFDEANTTTLPKNCGSSPNFTVCTADKKIVNPSVNTANNRLSTSDNYTFDAAGNLVVDAEGRQFTYDAENKQIQAENGSSQVIGQYYFDGDGKRVKKVVPGTDEITIFVYDASGKLIQEHSTIVQPSQDAKTQYLTNDHLGTPRINTDSTGQVVSRSDYMPYGEEIVGLGGRSSGQGYVTDDVRQGFTGYENDDETGLDYAQARMYAISTGRFTGVDGGAFTPADPQNFNRYVYVQNNPIKFVDPTGRDLELKGEDAEYIKSELEKFTGYKLVLKKGKITIDTSVERKEKGTSKSFAELISKITDKDFKGKVVVNLTSKPGENDKVFVDKFSDRKLDVGDYKVIQTGANELAGTLLSHVIKEYAVAASDVGTNPFPEMFTDEEYSFKTSHGEATQFEAQVLSELTGKDQGARREQSREPSSSTKQTFIFKSIEYDIQRKGSQGKAGFNTVTGVVSRPK